MCFSDDFALVCTLFRFFWTSSMSGTRVSVSCFEDLVDLNGGLDGANPLTKITTRPFQSLSFSLAFGRFSDHLRKSDLV